MTLFTVMEYRVRNDHEYVPLVESISWSFHHSWFITGCVTRLTQLVSLVEQELPLFRSTWVHSVFSGVCVIRSLVLYVCFVDRCLSFCTFFFCHCLVCSSSIYEFWLALWYLQTLLNNNSSFMFLHISKNQVICYTGFKQ